MRATEAQKRAMRNYRRSAKGRATRAKSQREWYLLNRDKELARTKKYVSEHRAERSQWQRKNYASNPEKYRRWQMWSLYRLTPQRFQELLNRQNGKCPCGTTFNTATRNKVDSPNVDHDHRCCKGMKSCGKCIRGLLCHKCNRALGLLGDSPELLRTLAAWIGERQFQE